MTRPENADHAEVQVASKELGAAHEPAQNKSAQNESAQNESVWKSPSDNGVAAAAAPPQQRQRAATGDADPDFSPSTVRIGGYTPPERVSPTVAGPAPSGSARSVRVPRRTSLQLQRLEPWSVLKLSLVLSVAGFLVWMIAVGVLYGVLAGMGVWDQINGTYSDLTSANNAQMSTELVSGGRVFGVAMVIGLVNIVLMTALATVGSLIYNVAADLVGGIEVTLSEPD